MVSSEGLMIASEMLMLVSGGLMVFSGGLTFLERKYYQKPCNKFTSPFHFSSLNKY